MVAVDGQVLDKSKYNKYILIVKCLFYRSKKTIAAAAAVVVVVKYHLDAYAKKEQQLFFLGIFLLYYLHSLNQLNHQDLANVDVHFSDYEYFLPKIYS
jgi:hypothetical protein